MKWLKIAGLLFAAASGAFAAGDAGFSSLVSPEDFAAAGLNTLSAAQRARLDALVENYKSGALAEARRAADEAIAQKRAAEAEAALEMNKAQAALAAAKAETTKAQLAQAEAQKEASKTASRADATKTGHPGFLATAKGMFGSAPKQNEPLVESTIPGKFQGWVPHQVFTLANGQRWQVANADSYYVPLTTDPKVQIFPSATVGYWMRFPGLRAEVRVKPVGGE